MRTRALALLAIAAVCALAARRLVATEVKAVPLACDAAFAIVDGRDERLACADDPALQSCRGLVPGERVRGCESVGPMRGAVLRLRGLPIDPNRASAEDLRALDGVGARTAAAIVEARAHGPFCTADDLERARGIGPKKARALAPLLRLPGPLCGAVLRE